MGESDGEPEGIASGDDDGISDDTTLGDVDGCDEFVAFRMMRTGGTAAAAAAPSPLFVPSNTPSMATASSRRSRMRYRHRCLFLGRTSTSDFDTTSCPISTSISMSSWLSFWLSLGSNAVEAVVPRRSIPSLSEYSSEPLLKIAISSRSDLDIAPM